MILTLKVRLNKEMYINIFRRLKDTVRRKRPENWRNNSWFLIQDNAPAHQSALMKDFLAKNNVTTLERPPYSLDVAAAHLY
jgi:transposase